MGDAQRLRGFFIDRHGCGGCQSLIPGIMGGPLLRGGMPVSDFLHTGLGDAVSGDDAVAAEVVVALPFTEVAAVTQDALSVGILIP